MASVFTSAMSQLIDVMSAADGKTIVLETVDGDVTLTALFRRTPQDWDAGESFIAGAGWQLVTKADALASYCGDMPGMSVTVDGTRYTIVRETLENAGLVVLDLGFARGY